MFDVDGVFTDGHVLINPDGQFIRKLSSKDGYAVQFAIKKGYRIVIITGGNSIAVRDGLQSLGIKYIFLESSNKVQVFDKFVADHKLKPEEIVYMGDDIPDYRVMQKAGLAVCPADAAEEIKHICHHVSNKEGGKGCVRDIIEQTMKVQGKWFDDDSHEW